ncbi:MAG TPA: hypothetical protein VFJ84_01595 [Candidatus Saccharimonadales bacterium]|nr:hypothetical protein [Candidatus Saccharimonadales bacterium]
MHQLSEPAGRRFGVAADDAVAVVVVAVRAGGDGGIIAVNDARDLVVGAVQHACDGGVVHGASPFGQLS